MKAETEENLIENCLTRMESKLGWGASKLWTNADFENLSEKITEVTGIQLSVTTLKRIFGRIKYESRPTVTTLNTLAQFIGFENWRTFVQEHSPAIVDDSGIDDFQPQQLDKEEHTVKQFPAKIKMKYLLPLAIAAILGIMSFYFFSPVNVRPSDSVDSISVKKSKDPFRFSSRKVVSTGVPNSVIFSYDASSSLSDSVYIQQSWDPRRTEKISRNGHQHGSIYYYPGFFKAKLVVDGKIIKEQDLYILTDGWLPMVEQDPVPLYFKETDARHDGVMGLPLKAIIEKKIALEPSAPWVDYFNVRDFNGVRTDNFIFETEVKNDYREGSGACQQSQVMILTENDPIIIPLSVKGCVSDLQLYFIDKRETGKTDDLTAFGADLNRWTTVKCQVKEKQGKIYINGLLAYEGSFQSDATKITGLVFRFQGSGSVKSVRLSGVNRNVVFQDGF